MSRANTPLRWGMIGGGQGSQIGETHRMAAVMDRKWTPVCAAPDIDPDRGRRFAVSLGLDPERAYGSWQELVEGERGRRDAVQLVTVATPNSTHYEITRACLEAGFNVLCEKPLTMTFREAKALANVAEKANRKLVVNFGYTGYPMVREMRAMVQGGKLGNIHLAFAQFAHGHHSDADDADNPRIRWRYDPSQAGVSSIVADCGIHAQQMTGYVLGQRIESVSADYLSAIGGRELEDDAAVQSRLEGGTRARLWTSAVATGHVHGLQLEVFGDKGGLCWRQERPDRLLYSPLGKPVRILERGQGGLSKDARESSRITIGHPEGFPAAFANIYRDIALALKGSKPALARLPSVEDGIEMVRFVEQATRSAGKGGRWMAMQDVRAGSRG
ncbi:MAG: oxidoreductase [Gammaproteobacteria bacterium]|nr:MAG: oxidoreductase [Gammaproteobacteria bacterium]